MLKILFIVVCLYCIINLMVSTINVMYVDGINAKDPGRARYIYQTDWKYIFPLAARFSRIY